ncbi:hypothetical protein [Schaalia cardiffensis]
MEQAINKLASAVEGINGRLDKMDKRFDSIEGRLDTLEAQSAHTAERLDSLEQEVRATRDVVTDMELRFTERFDWLDGRMDHLVGVQKEMQADIAAVRHSLFIEEGSRGSADESLFGEQRRDYVKLEKRVRVMEAKFPDLAQRQAA